MHLLPLFKIVFMVLLLSAPQIAEAYIGPGAGIGAIGTVLALIGAILIAILSLIWYPIKLLLVKNKNKRKTDQDSDSL